MGTERTTGSVFPSGSTKPTSRASFVVDSSCLAASPTPRLTMNLEPTLPLLPEEESWLVSWLRSSRPAPQHNPLRKMRPVASQKSLNDMGDSGKDGKISLQF